MERRGTFAIAAALIVGLVSGGPVPTQYSLTVSSTERGSVTNPGDATSTYDEGDGVDLVASPSAKRYLRGFRAVNALA